MPIAVHQLLVGAAAEDAITNMALATRETLRENRESEIFSFHRDKGAEDRGIRTIEQMDDLMPGSALLYHASFGVPEVTKRVLGWEGPLLLAYHNVTPSVFFRRFDAVFADGLDWGREELNIIRGRVRHAFADSKFNAAELRNLGYESVTVNPLGMRPGRLSHVLSDQDLLLRLRTRFREGFVLLVSQVLPHKQMETAISATHLLNHVFGRRVGLVIVGPHRHPRYLGELESFCASKPGLDVEFTGSVTDEHLATYLRNAICLLSTSAHEGLSLPPLEAMAEETCVLVKSAGALDETIDDGGLVLPADVGPLEIAGVINHLLDEPDLQTSLRVAGKRRLERLASATDGSSLSDLIDAALS